MRTINRKTIALCLFLIIALSTVGMVTAASVKTTAKTTSSSSSSWLKGTIWSIRDFNGRTSTERADKGEWIFTSSSKVSAYVPLNYWKGNWKKLTDDRIQVNIGSNNAVEIIFINHKYFIAIDHTSKNFRYTGELVTK